MQETLANAVGNIPALQAVFVTAMPDCLLFDSWSTPDSGFDSEDAATYFGDLVRANRQGLKALNSWSTDMQVTIESSDKLIVIRELNDDFVCSCVFDKDAALGMVRLQMRQLLARLADTLPSFEVEDRPRGVRIVDFLNRYAPDPHAVLLRVALRSGIPVARLEEPQELNGDEVQQLEVASCKILNLKSLNV